MPTIRFWGRVLPAEAQITIDGDPRVEWEAAERDLKMAFSIRIHSSAILIECEANKYEAGDLVHIYARAFDLARSAVELLAFAMGFGLTVQIYEFADDGDNKKPVLLADPRLPPLCTAFKINTGKSEDDFKKVLMAVMLNTPLQGALNDLIESISHPHRAPANCARALERMRHMITPGSSTKDKKAWEALRTNLRVSQSFVEYLTDYSTGPRHGDPKFIPGNVTNEISRRAWILMDRFLEFKKRGDQPLPPSDFPLL